MKMVKRAAFASCVVFFAVVLSACGELVYKDSSENLPKLYEEANLKIKPGETPRSTIRAMFGSPILADEGIHFEVYQKNTSDDIIFVAYFVPVFSPGESDFDVYVAVSYDANWKVQDYKYFFISEPSPAGAKLRDYPDHGEITVGNYTFGAYWQDEGSFFKNYKRNTYLFGPDKSLASAPMDNTSANCILYLTASGEILRDIRGAGEGEGGLGGDGSSG